MRHADFLFMESTYGNRNHKGEEDSLEELAEAIKYSYSRGEKVIIPAFAVERTQEILYSLYLLSQTASCLKTCLSFWIALWRSRQRKYSAVTVPIWMGKHKAF